MRRVLSVTTERWPVTGVFAIARDAVTEIVVVVATIEAEGLAGRGECRPYARYGETPGAVAAAIEQLRDAIEAGADRHELQELMPPGAARNALDCALWDLDAKTAGLPAYRLAGLDRLSPAVTAFTLSLGLPAEMAEAAARAAGRPILKVKLGGGARDPERLAAVRRAAPDAVLIVDANEGWSEAELGRNLEACARAGVALVEQPLPAGQDAALARVPHPIPVCADESAHGLASLERLAGRYEVASIKLDKTGGLTEALAAARAAEALGLRLMVGCMLSTSLAIAPAMLLTPRAAFVDLDAPLLLARDRVPGMRYEGSVVYPAVPELWG